MKVAVTAQTRSIDGPAGLGCPAISTLNMTGAFSMSPLPNSGKIFCALWRDDMEKIAYKSIGIIHTPFTDVSGMPIQAAGLTQAVAKIDNIV